MFATIRHSKLAGLLALSLLASWRVAAADPALVIPPQNPAELARMNPVQFLDWLKSGDGRHNVVSVSGPIEGWVREEHIPALLVLLDSQTECAAVVEVHSSFMPRGSTIGDEAALMIQSFRDGHYPSMLSAGPMRQPGRKQELRDWWKARAWRPPLRVSSPE